MEHKVACPSCGEEIVVIHRHFLDRLVGIFYPSKRWRCNACGWTALLASHNVALHRFHILHRIFKLFYVVFLIALICFCIWMALMGMGILFRSISWAR